VLRSARSASSCGQRIAICPNGECIPEHGKKSSESKGFLPAGAVRAARFRTAARYKVKEPTAGDSGSGRVLSGVEIARPDQFWAVDITYIAMARGFAASSIWPWLSRLVQPPRAVMAAVDHHGRGILHRDIGGCVGASRQARHLQHRPGFAVHWGRPSLACLPATALRSRKHSSIRPCCPSRPQRTWDLHQTLLGQLSDAWASVQFCSGIDDGAARPRRLSAFLRRLHLPCMPVLWPFPRRAMSGVVPGM
jgi:hypothetical protein